MTQRLYSILVLSVIVSFTGNAQNNNEEPALDKIQDATSDVKKYDKVNYQHIADQKYFKNNPDALTDQLKISLEEQNSLKSADQSADYKGVNTNQTPLDESSRYYSASEVALDSKIELSAEELLEQKMENKNEGSSALRREKNSKSEYEQPIEKKPQLKQNTSNTLTSNTKTSNKATNKEVPTQSKKSEVSKLVATTKKEELKVKQVVDSVKLKAVKELVNAPFIHLKDNHKVASNQKSTQLVKVVDKTTKQTEVINMNIQSSSEDRVVDQLINSGIYDVYDDGKYIKFSIKRNK